MTRGELLRNAVRHRGGVIYRDEEGIRVLPNTLLTSADKAWVRAHRTEIVGDIPADRPPDEELMWRAEIATKWSAVAQELWVAEAEAFERGGASAKDADLRAYEAVRDGYLAPNDLETGVGVELKTKTAEPGSATQNPRISSGRRHAGGSEDIEDAARTSIPTTGVRSSHKAEVRRRDTRALEIQHWRPGAPRPPHWLFTKSGRPRTRRDPNRDWKGGFYAPPAYERITSPEVARGRIAELPSAPTIIGADLETAVRDDTRDHLKVAGALSPFTGYARTLQLSAPDQAVLVIDLREVGGLEAVADLLGHLRLTFHNTYFDLRFFQAAGIEIEPECSMLAAQVLTGAVLSLSSASQRFLGVAVRKDEQASDWEDDLSVEQLRYAATDAAAARELFDVVFDRLEGQGSVPAYKAAKRALPALVEMHLCGLPIDRERRLALLGELEPGVQSLLRQCHEATDCHFTEKQRLAKWVSGRLDSTGRNRWMKTASGALSVSKDALRKGSVLLPAPSRSVVKDVLIPLSEELTLFNMIGNGWEPFLAYSRDGRIRSEITVSCETGRMSSSRPNVQNLPRDPRVRSLIRAPAGRKLVVADFSQIELRALAVETEDERLLLAYEQGEDVHGITAAGLIDCTLEEFQALPEAERAEKRRLAKAANFGLAYGTGPSGFRSYASTAYGIDMSEDDAQRWIERWRQTYPGVARWHRQQARQFKSDRMARTRLGRVRDLGRATRSRREPWEGHRYNTVIQGSCAEVLMLALADTRERVRRLGLDARLVGTVHDEIILEAGVRGAEAAAEALGEAMRHGWLSVYPTASTVGLVEPKVVADWSGSVDGENRTSTGAAEVSRREMVEVVGQRIE